MIPAYISSILLAQFDRIMINSYIGSAEAGLYSFAYNISSLQIMLANALIYAWVPEYYRYMNDGNYRQHDQDVIKLVRLIALTSCGLILFADQIGRVLGASNYHAALSLIPIIVAGQFFIAFNSFTKNHVSYSKKTYVSAVVILLGATLNVILNIIYIPKHGMIAGAYTTLISYIFQAALMIIAVKYYLKAHITNPLRMLDALFVLGIASVCYYSLMNISANVFMDLILKLLAFFLIASLLYRKALRQYILSQSSTNS